MQAKPGISQDSITSYKCQTKIFQEKKTFYLIISAGLHYNQPHFGRLQPYLQIVDWRQKYAKDQHSSLFLLNVSDNENVFFTFFLAAITANCSHSTDPLTLRQRVECSTTVLELLANRRYLSIDFDRQLWWKTQTLSSKHGAYTIKLFYGRNLRIFMLECLSLASLSSLV